MIFALLAAFAASLVYGVMLIIKIHLEEIRDEKNDELRRRRYADKLEAERKSR